VFGTAEAPLQQLERLKEEHRNLLVLVGRLTELLGSEAPPAATLLYAFRQEFASALIRHLKSEDWLLYPRLMCSSNAELSRLATAFSEEMGGVAETFRAHSERWGADAIAADWNGYRHETAELLRALVLRIQREERDLYPRCSDLAAISLGVGA
jgi:hypothetical protein